MTIKLPDIFQNGMVLQHGKQIKVWGKVNPSQQVNIRLTDVDEIETQADRQGNFVAYIPPQKPACGLELAVSTGNDRYVVSNVSIGEVWLLAGQSNMNLLLRYDHDYHNNPEKVLSNIPLGISFYEVPKMKVDSYTDPHFDDRGQWQSLNRENAEQFSAVGFYFAIELAKQLKKIPIGLIWMAYDGTTASSWTSEKALSRSQLLKKIYIDGYKKIVDNRPDGEYQQYLQTVEEQNRNPESGPFWDNVLTGNISHEDLCDAYKNKHYLFVDYVMGPQSENCPHGLFDTMASKIVGYTIKGMLWYQGESDDIHAEVYDTLLTTMINDWRNRWGYVFPVLEMQIAPFYHWFGAFYGTYFPDIRAKQQLVAERLPKVYMTNVMDTGMKYDIHPKKKQIAGQRFAILAFDKVYSWRKHCAAPLVIDHRRNTENLEISFSETNLLSLHDAIEESLTVTVAGKNVRFNVETCENRLIITINERLTNAPVTVKYQWTPYSEAKLFNENGIPVSPFEVNL